MKLHLWHFTTSAAAAKSIEEFGFWDMDTFQFGTRWPCFSQAGERHWESERGPALVEVWLEIDEDVLAAEFTRRCRDGDRVITYYQFIPELLNFPHVRRLAHENADHLSRTPEEYDNIPD
jgi:hypothetical protein